jgi:histidyl-tRNA synthetase
MTALEHMIPKTVVRAKFGYAYNVRTLKNEADQLKETMISANDMLSKISNVAEKFGVEIIEPPSTAVETSKEETPATTVLGDR